MSISDDSIEEFQRIWKKEFGEEITKEEAREHSENLVSFYKLLIDIDRTSYKERPTN